MCNKLSIKVLFILTFFIGFPAYAAKTLTIATTDWQPYVHKSNAYKGYAHDIVKQAFAAAGYDVKIVFMPWNVALAALKVGKVDGLFPEYYSHDRAATMAFSQPFAGGPIALYKKRGNGAHYPSPNPLIDLNKAFNGMQQYRFGVVAGYSNIPTFDHNRHLMKVTAINDKANLEQLYKGKVQVAMIDKYVADYLLNYVLPPQYAQQLVFMPPVLGYQHLYLGVSKNNVNYKKILHVFNSGLAAIKKNGKMAAILDRDALEGGSQLA